MDEQQLWIDEGTFARMMIDAYEVYGFEGASDYYYATASHAFDLLLTGEIVTCNGKMIKLASKRLVKIYNPETRDFE